MKTIQYIKNRLYAYFNDKNNKIQLDQILYGYIELSKRIGEITITTDMFGKVYLPNFGWLHTKEKNKELQLVTTINDISLFYDNQSMEFLYEPLEIIKNTNIELIKFPVPLLEQCYYDVNNNLIEVEIINITNKQRENLYKAWGLIKELIPKHFEIMKKYIFYLILIISIGFFFYKNYFGHAKSNKILIDKFSTTIIDSLSPVSGKGYSIQLIKIKGSIDDSIMIKGFYGYPIYLKRTFNKEFNNEYYGSSPSVIKIDPYKAKTGELQIIHIIK